MKKKLLFFLILMSGIVYSSNAQDDNDNDYNEKEPTLSLFINTTALLHPKLSGLVLGGEYRWKPHLGIHQQLGYVFTDYDAANDNFDNSRKRRGFRTSSELRRYFNSFDRTVSNSYLGLQLRYWKYKETGEFEFCRENCQFQQFLEYELNQYALGAGLSTGAVSYLGEHFFIDYGLTLGAMYRKNQSNIPQDATRVRNGSPGLNEPNPQNFEVSEAYFLCYLKLGYSF